jgi:hypothetical protein
MMLKDASIRAYSGQLDSFFPQIAQSKTNARILRMGGADLESLDEDETLIFHTLLFPLFLNLGSSFLQREASSLDRQLWERSPVVLRYWLPQPGVTQG